MLDHTDQFAISSDFGRLNIRNPDDDPIYAYIGECGRLMESKWISLFPNSDDVIVLKVVLDRTGNKLVVSDYDTEKQLFEREFSETNCDGDWNRWTNDLIAIYKDTNGINVMAFKRGNLFVYIIIYTFSKFKYANLYAFYIYRIHFLKNRRIGLISRDC